MPPLRVISRLIVDGARPDPASLDENPSHGRVMPIEQPRHLVQRLALPPAVPHQGLVAVGTATQSGHDGRRLSAISSAIRLIHRRLLWLGRKRVATPPRGGQLAAPMPSTWSPA